MFYPNPNDFFQPCTKHDTRKNSLTQSKDKQVQEHNPFLCTPASEVAQNYLRYK